MQLSPFLWHNNHCLMLPHLEQEPQQKGPGLASSIHVPEDMSGMGPLVSTAAV